MSVTIARARLAAASRYGGEVQRLKLELEIEKLIRTLERLDGLTDDDLARIQAALPDSSAVGTVWVGPEGKPFTVIGVLRDLAVVEYLTTRRTGTVKLHLFGTKYQAHA